MRVKYKYVYIIVSPSIILAKNSYSETLTARKPYETSKNTFNFILVATCSQTHIKTNPAPPKNEVMCTIKKLKLTEMVIHND